MKRDYQDESSFSSWYPIQSMTRHVLNSDSLLSVDKSQASLRRPWELAT